MLKITNFSFDRLNRDPTYFWIIFIIWHWIDNSSLSNSRWKIFGFLLVFSENMNFSWTNFDRELVWSHPRNTFLVSFVIRLSLICIPIDWWWSFLLGSIGLDWSHKWVPQFSGKFSDMIWNRNNIFKLYVKHIIGVSN